MHWSGWPGNGIVRAIVPRFHYPKPINSKRMHTMWKSIAITSACLCMMALRAEPELKGSPAELTAYLATLPKTVSITGESELKAAADRAIVSFKSCH